MYPCLQVSAIKLKTPFILKDRHRVGRRLSSNIPSPACTYHFAPPFSNIKPPHFFNLLPAPVIIPTVWAISTASTSTTSTVLPFPVIATMASVAVVIIVATAIAAILVVLVDLLSLLGVFGADLQGVGLVRRLLLVGRPDKGKIDRGSYLSNGVGNGARSSQADQGGEEVLDLHDGLCWFLGCVMRKRKAQVAFWWWCICLRVACLDFLGCNQKRLQYLPLICFFSTSPSSLHGSPSSYHGSRRKVSVTMSIIDSLFKHAVTRIALSTDAAVGLDLVRPDRRMHPSATLCRARPLNGFHKVSIAVL